MSCSTISNYLYLKYKLYSAIKKMNVTPQSFTFRLCAVIPSQECGTEVGGGGGTLQQRNLPSAASGSDQRQHLQ